VGVEPVELFVRRLGADPVDRVLVRANEIRPRLDDDVEARETGRLELPGVMSTP